MRRQTFCLFGALAMIGSAAVAQGVDLMHIKRLDLDRLTIKIPPPRPLPPPPPQAPQVKFRGCVYYEHDNWQGKWRSIPGGTRRLALGPSWDERISSFACSPSCRVVAFTDDFKGQRGEFGTTNSVGGQWNDKISSMIASCQHPF